MGEEAAVTMSRLQKSLDSIGWDLLHLRVTGEMPDGPKGALLRAIEILLECYHDFGSGN